MHNINIDCINVHCIYANTHGAPGLARSFRRPHGPGSRGPGPQVVDQTPGGVAPQKRRGAPKMSTSDFLLHTVDEFHFEPPKQP